MTRVKSSSSASARRAPARRPAARATRSRSAPWTRLEERAAMLVPAKSVTIIALRRGLDRADEKRLWNQTGGCKSHHVSVHELGLRVTGKAPDALEWTLDGEPFTGM